MKAKTVDHAAAMRLANLQYVDTPDDEDTFNTLAAAYLDLVQVVAECEHTIVEMIEDTEAARVELRKLKELLP